MNAKIDEKTNIPFIYTQTENCINRYGYDANMKISELYDLFKNRLNVYPKVFIY